MLNRILTTGLMVGERPAPIGGMKPEEKKETIPGKHNYNLYIAIMAVLMAAIVVGVVVFMAQTPAKTSQDASQEVETQEVQQSAENVVVSAATAETGSYVPMNLPGNKDIPLDNMPEEIFLTNQIYLKGFKKQGSYIYVTIGSTADIKDQGISFVYLDKDGKIIGIQTYGFQFGSKNPNTGQYTFGDSQEGKVNFLKGKEFYARIPMPIPEAKYLGMQTIS